MSKYIRPFLKLAVQKPALEAISDRLEVTIQGSNNRIVKTSAFISKWAIDGTKCNVPHIHDIIDGKFLKKKDGSGGSDTGDDNDEGKEDS